MFFLIETQYFKMYIKEKKTRSHVKDFTLNSSIKTCWFTQKKLLPSNNFWRNTDHFSD